MFFPAHEKLIYAPPDHPAGASYDPLALDRELVRLTGGRLSALLVQHRAGSDGLGNVDAGAEADNALQSARAEEELVRAARTAFGLPDFPASTDGVALELLWHYLEYMEGKGEPGATRPPSADCSASPGDPRPTPTS